MKIIFGSLKRNIFKTFLLLPFFRNYKSIWFRKLGIQLGRNARINTDIRIVGSYSNLKVASNAEINAGCFILAKDMVTLGENSTLAYQATVLTSANPNGPYNKLARIYPKMSAPVYIGSNSWIGAGAIILPGVTVGNFCVVAAGAIVTKDVSNFTVVAGVPAKEIRKLNPKDFE